MSIRNIKHHCSYPVLLKRSVLQSITNCFKKSFIQYLAVIVYIADSYPFLDRERDPKTKFQKCFFSFSLHIPDFVVSCQKVQKVLSKSEKNFSEQNFILVSDLKENLRKMDPSPQQTFLIHFSSSTFFLKYSFRSEVSTTIVYTHIDLFSESFNRRSFFSVIFCRLSFWSSDHTVYLKMQERISF